MALVLLDGCEEAAASGVPVTFTAAATAVAGRNGNGLRASSGFLRYTLPTALESDTLTLGFAMFLPAAVTAAGTFLTLRSDGLATTHLTLSAKTDGSVAIQRGTATQLAISAAGVFPIATWFYVELQAKLADSGGFATLRVDGTQVATFTGDTKNAGTKTVYEVFDLSPGSLGTVPVYDDIYVQNGAADTFLGPVTVETLYPNGDGNANQWVGSDGNSVSNYLLVDETPPTFVDYTKSATVGEVDQYALADLKATAGTIVGVCHHAAMILLAAGSQTIALVNRRTTDNVGTTQTCNVTANLQSFQQTYAVDPETGGAWTIANVNALQTGVKVL